MEFSPMRLLVYAVVAIALIYIFMNYMLPYFFPQQNALDAVENGIKAAETGLGKTVGGGEIIFPKGMGISGEGFDKRNRYVTFSCDNPEYCCAVGQDVQEGCRVLVDQNTHRNAQFKELARAETYFRCGYESNLYTCRVYLGGKPAQIEIADVEFKDEFDLSTEDVAAKFKAKNSGELPAFDIVATANVYSVEKDETGREVENFYEGPLTKRIEKINAGESEEVEFSLQINDGGSYVVRLYVEAFDAGFDRNEFKFSADAPLITLGCKATSLGDAIERNGKCVQKQLCNGCNFAFECVLKWQQAGAKELELADPAFAYAPSPEFEGRCESAADCSATVQSGEAKLTRGECRTGLSCVDCTDAEECKGAWAKKIGGTQSVVAGDYSTAYVIRENSYCGEEIRLPEPEKPAEFVKPPAVPPAPLGAEPMSFCDFEGEITSANNPARFAGCSQHLELLKKYLAENGLKERGFDILLLEALVFAESSCSAKTANCQGLMQVTECAQETASGCVSVCTTVEDNITRGTKHLMENYDAVVAKGITGLDSVKLILFSYNRGEGTVRKAIELYTQNPEAGLQKAMEEACFYYYDDKRTYMSPRGNCSGYSRDKCCAGVGLGANYADRIIGYYKEACEDAKVEGTVSDIAKPVVKGKTVVLDPGHSTRDWHKTCAAPGAPAANGAFSNEADYVWDIALKIKPLLETKGYVVLMTKQGISDGPNCDERAEAANASKASVFVSLHLNANRDTTANGTETFLCEDIACGSERVTETRILANEINNRLVGLGFKNRGISPDTKARVGRISVLRHTKMPAVLTEMAFISNAADKQLLDDEAGRQRIAEAIAAGIEAYLSAPA